MGLPRLAPLAWGLRALTLLGGPPPLEGGPPPRRLNVGLRGLRHGPPRRPGGLRDGLPNLLCPLPGGLRDGLLGLRGGLLPPRCGLNFIYFPK